MPVPPVPIVAGNWKMNTSIQEGVKLAQDMMEGLDSIQDVEKVLCPPFISLEAVSKLVLGTSIRVGAQNMHHEEKGAFTGEVSPSMLTGLCQYVILGHSERRQLFREDDRLINLKAEGRHGCRPEPHPLRWRDPGAAPEWERHSGGGRPAERRPGVFT